MCDTNWIRRAELVSGHRWPHGMRLFWTDADGRCCAVCPPGKSTILFSYFWCSSWLCTAGHGHDPIAFDWWKWGRKAKRPIQKAMQKTVHASQPPYICSSPAIYRTYLWTWIEGEKKKKPFLIEVIGVRMWIDWRLTDVIIIVPKMSSELWWFATIMHAWSFSRCSLPRNSHFRPNTVDMWWQNELAHLLIGLIANETAALAMVDAI